MPNRPPAQTDQWMHITDFSAGCINYAETTDPTAERFDPTNPAQPGADPARTFSCIALPAGGLGALPALTTTWNWAGTSSGTNTAYLVGMLVHDELTNGDTEAFVISEWDDGTNHHWEADSFIVETLTSTNIVSTTEASSPGCFGSPYPTFTRVNLTAISGVTVTSGSANLTVSSGGFPGAEVGGTVIIYSVTSGTPVIPIDNEIISIVGNTLTLDAAHIPTGSGVAVIGVSSTELPGQPVIAFPNGGAASPTNTSTGQLYIYPDPTNPTAHSAFPLIYAEGAAYSSVTGQVICYDNRILCLVGTGYGWPAGSGFNTNENINFTDPPNSASYGDQMTVLAAEDPFGYGGASSVSAGELFIIKKRGGGLVVTGDIFSPNVTFLPGVQPTGGFYGQAGAGSLGVFYCSLYNGAWLWNGGNTSQKISTQLDDNFFLPDEFGGNLSEAYGYFVQCIGDKAYFSKNWIYDMTLNSWWKYSIDSTQGGLDWFWVNPVSGRYIYLGVLSFKGTGIFMGRLDCNTPSQAYQWCSLPLALASPNHVSDIRQITIIASCTAPNCQITVEVLDDGSSVESQTQTGTVSTGPEMIRFNFAALGVTKPQILISVVNGSLGDMAIIHDIGILFDTRAPIAANN